MLNDLRDLVMLLYGVPQRFITVHLTLQTWYNPVLHGEAWERWAALQPPGSVAQLRSASSMPLAKEAVQFWRQRLWLQPPDRWREEGENGMLTIVRERFRWLSGLPWKQGLEQEINPAQGWRSLLGDLALAEMLEPAALLPAVWLDLLGETHYAGRPAWQVRAVPREPGHPVFPHVLWLGADEYELLVDSERGVLLRCSARFDGREFAGRELLEVIFDEAFPDDLFRPRE